MKVDPQGPYQKVGCLCHGNSRKRQKKKLELKTGKIGERNELADQSSSVNPKRDKLRGNHTCHATVKLLQAKDEKETSRKLLGENATRHEGGR